MLFLQTQDYEILDGQLSISLNGFVLIFYTSDICKICDRLKPQFNKLAKTVHGCTFAFMNVSQDNMKIRTIAAQTGFKIDYVPIFVLYSNKRPVAMFDLNENNLESFGNDLRSWLIATTAKLNEASYQDAKPTAIYSQQQQQRQTNVPYSGRPKPSGRDNIGYMTFNDAYMQNAPAQTNLSNKRRGYEEMQTQAKRQRVM